MKSINKAVEDVVRNSAIPYFALQDGVLNLSAYAKAIQKDVENECKKPLKSTNAIVMALSRLQKRVSKHKIKLPKISVSAVTIKRNLSELSIYKSPKALKLIQEMLVAPEGKPNILLVNYGLSQINLIVQNMTEAQIKKIFGPYSPSAILPNLVSITMSVPEEDVMVPNIFFTLLSKFATEEINIVEITTAKFEQSLIIEEHLLPKAYAALSDILERKEKLF